MNLVPQRHSLLAETTALLRNAILSGSWTGVLPGERKLCQRMQVGRDTVRAAIQQIEREGLVAPCEPGRQRRITAPKRRANKAHPSPVGVVAFLTPHRMEKLSEPLLLEVDVLRDRLAGSGYRLEIVTNHKVFTLARPGKTLEKLTTELSADAWVLHQTTAPMQSWFATKGLPCLVHGQPQGVDLPFVDIDYVAVGRHAGGILIGRGHRSVAFLRPHAPLKGLEMAESGLREAFAGHIGEALQAPVTVRESPAGGVRSVVARLERLMNSSTPPTALVLTRARQVLTTISWLATQRLRVPQDLSLIALDYSPSFDHLVPEVACYKSDAEATAQLVFRKVFEIASSGAMVGALQPLMPDFVSGASVARL